MKKNAKLKNNLNYLRLVLNFKELSVFFAIFAFLKKLRLEKTRIYQNHFNGGLCRGFAAFCRRLNDRMQGFEGRREGPRHQRLMEL